MSLLTESYWIDLLLAFLLMLFLMYWFITYNDGYWDQRGVLNVKEGLVINQLRGKQSQAETVKEWYEKFPDEKFFGFILFRKPVLMFKDLDLIHHVLVKDFHHFQDRGQPENKRDLMSHNLFGMRGQMWREMRYKLTPTFTTGKLRGMFEQVSKCGANMIRRIEELTKKNSDIESKDFLLEFTADVIASCAFGVQFEPNSPEFNAFKKTVQRVFKPSVWAMGKLLITITFPKLAESLKLRLFMDKENSEYFMTLIKETTKYRKENNIERNDYLQLLLTLKDQEDRGVLSHMGLSSGDTCEDDEVILDQIKYSGSDLDQPLTSNVKHMTVCANSVIFLVAGSESTSSSISLTLFELATHLDIQQRLQKEDHAVHYLSEFFEQYMNNLPMNVFCPKLTLKVGAQIMLLRNLQAPKLWNGMQLGVVVCKDPLSIQIFSLAVVWRVDTVLINHKGQWSYQAVKDMTYLDQVVQESQRMHPIIPFLQRECTKPYKVPGSDLVIEKGGIIGIPVAGLHNDPKFYPDPELFRPERFEGNNFKPNPAFLPFGDGPRICIAMRFAVMEVKTSLARIMANYTVKLSPKTQVPLQLDPRSFVPLAKGGLWLQFEKRNNATL